MREILPGGLARRERQVMELLFEKGRLTAREVLEALPDPPSYSAVRALMVTLEKKNLVAHSREGKTYIYEALVEPEKAKRSALRDLLGTFFEGKPEKLVASLLDPKDQELSQDEIARIRSIISEEDRP